MTYRYTIEKFIIYNNMYSIFCNRNHTICILSSHKRNGLNT